MTKAVAVFSVVMLVVIVASVLLSSATALSAGTASSGNVIWKAYDAFSSLGFTGLVDGDGCRNWAGPWVHPPPERRF